VAVAIVVLAMLVAACAGPTANVMAMRDIPREQQDRDRADCERQAGELNVTKPLTGSMSGQLVYAAAGAALGLLFTPVALQSSSSPKEVALVAGGAAAVGAALGFVAGTVVGWKSGVDRAHDEYVSAYTACMRQRGYTVIRERR